jgi:hypothetical protein
MDINLLNERLAVLETQHKETQKVISQAMANINALEGAIQETSYWIKQLNPRVVEPIKENNNDS